MTMKTRMILAMDSKLSAHAKSLVILTFLSIFGCSSKKEFIQKIQNNNHSIISGGSKLSGTQISDDIIVTCAHGISENDKYNNVLYINIAKDIAFITLSKKENYDLTPNISFGEPYSGQMAYAVGDPGGWYDSISYGVVTVLDNEYYILDTVGHEGQSGGGIYDAENHKLIGIAAAKIPWGRILFIPSNKILISWEEMIENIP